MCTFLLFSHANYHMPPRLHDHLDNLDNSRNLIMIWRQCSCTRAHGETPGQWMNVQGQGPMSDILAPNSCTSTFTDIFFLRFPKAATLESLTRGQGRATGNNTGTKTRLPLEMREQRSHSGYDNCLLNYIKPQCCLHAAGMSPLTQRNFIALPSHCPGDTGGTKAAVTPRTLKHIVSVT